MWNTRAQATARRAALSRQREEHESVLWLGVVLSCCSLLIVGLVRARLRILQEEREQRQLRGSGIA